MNGRLMEFTNQLRDSLINNTCFTDISFMFISFISKL